MKLLIFWLVYTFSIEVPLNQLDHSSNCQHSRHYFCKDRQRSPLCMYYPSTLYSNIGNRVSMKNLVSNSYRVFEYLNNRLCEVFPFRDFAKATLDQMHCRILLYHALTKNLSYYILFNRCIHRMITNFNLVNISSTFYC
jgi:hypothetical protein